MPLIRKDRDGAQTPPPPDRDPLIALTSGTADARWAAARALAASPDAAKALGEALAAEADARVREAILTGLARAGGPESVAAVLPHLRSEDASLRIGALDALRAMPQAVRPHLGALLGDPDSDVRLLACEIVRGLTTEEATPLLCELLEHEDQPNVCAAAVDVLAETGGPDALPVLARCAGRFAGEPFLAFSIKVAAERIGAQSDSRA